jgi:CRP/FNR family transcriptional regulator, cyclic AMP receptor protein
VTVSIEELAAVPALTLLSGAELDSLAAAAERIDVPAGTELAVEGDFGHSVFIVLQGTARVAVQGETVRELSAGDAFGEIAVLASGRRTASVTAETPMTLVSLFKRDVWELERQNPAFGERLRSITQLDP